MRLRALGLVVVTLLLASCAPEETGLYRLTVLTEGAHTFADGDVVTGDLVMLRGAATVEEGARVAGGVYMLSGDVTLDGSVGGDVLMLNGTLRLGPTAHVAGNVDATSGRFERHPDARIDGRLTAAEGLGFPDLALERPGFAQFMQQALMTSALMAALAALVAWSLPGPVARIGRTAVEQPAVSGALGILTLITAPSLLVMMIFTVLLAPLALIGFAVAAMLSAYAWIALGAAAGRGAAAVLGHDGRPSVVAGGGTGLITFAFNVLGLVPLLAVGLAALALAIGVGAVLLTGFGRRAFVPASAREELVAREVSEP